MPYIQGYVVVLGEVEVKHNRNTQVITVNQHGEWTSLLQEEFCYCKVTSMSFNSLVPTPRPALLVCTRGEPGNETSL